MLISFSIIESFSQKDAKCRCQLHTTHVGIQNDVLCCLVFKIGCKDSFKGFQSMFHNVLTFLNVCKTKKH